MEGDGHVDDEEAEEEGNSNYEVLEEHLEVY